MPIHPALALVLAFSPTPPPPPPPPSPAPVAESEAGRVLHPELAAAAPRPDWRWEGSADEAPLAHDDALDGKIRRSAVTVITGGSVAVVGGMLAIAGAGMTASRPESKLGELDAQDPPAPSDDAKRRHYERTAAATPYVLYGGAGLAAAGVLVAVLARLRLKKLREQRRSNVAFGIASGRHEVSALVGVRF